MQRTLLFLIMIILGIISIQLDGIYDTLKYDYRPISSCVHHNTWDVSVHEGGEVNLPKE